MEKTAIRSEVSGEITAPSSKSYAQRAIAAALLADGESILTNMTLCEDTGAALDIAYNLGAEIEQNDYIYRIKGGLNPRTELLNVRESGLSTRLFTPIASLCQIRMTLTGSGSIMRRPIDMMESPLEQLGVTIHSNGGYLPIDVEGEMKGGEINVDGSISSQFITGLLMALPLAKNDTTMNVMNLTSRPYIDMTLQVCEAFGVAIRHNNYEQFYIEGGQQYCPTRYNIEGDWSGASCLLVAGATAGSVTVKNLNLLSLQADTGIIKALERAGAQIISSNDSITVRKSNLKAFEFDATHCPDLFPALAALAASCEGTSVIKGTHRLTHKESDRARTIAETFESMGINVDIETDDIMRITGGPIKSATISSHNDHRIAMAVAITALNSDKQVHITEAEAVEKSYPGFWRDLNHIRTEKSHE